jgi:hypothetical protein
LTGDKVSITLIGMAEISLYRRKLKMLRLRKLGIPDVLIALQVGISKQRVGQILGPKKPNDRAKGPP